LCPWQHPEYRRLNLLEMRAKDPHSVEGQARRELTRLQKSLADEHIQTTVIQARIESLRQNLGWWEREMSTLDEPLPSAVPSDPALRAHLLALKKAGKLHGDLSFSA
jgi:hypothetical protein